MEVRPGYKQTEVGVIPEDWRIQPIEQISTVGRGRVISHREIARSLNPRYPVYSSQTSNDGVMGYLDTFEFEGEYITWTTDGANAGTVFARNGRFNCTNVCGTIKLKSDNHFFVAKVLGKIAPRHVSRHLGNPKLMNDVMKRVKIPLPPTKAEQEAIAEALSDADALIESLEQLVAKNRQLKQGAMQELLTGKKRLPGFSGEWEVKRLGELAEIVMGQSPSSAHYNSREDGLPLIQGNADISDRQTIKRVFTTEVTKRGRSGDILMSVRAPAGEVSRAIFDVCLGRGVCAIRYPNDFLYYALIAKEPTWTRLSKGSTFDSVNSTDVKAFEIEVPADESEQTAIVAILSDMDAEIAALEAKLAKARQVKQGMMQELLTGRTRLV